MLPIPQCGSGNTGPQPPLRHSGTKSGDIAITNKLRIALKTIDVRVLGHLVTGNSLVVSFAGRGLL
jgi:DNA repair protein RadC